MTENDNMTLSDAKALVAAGAEKGVKCPCCGRFVKLYKRKLHAEMAVFLIKLVKYFEDKGHGATSRELIPDAVKSSTDGSYLVLWGLVRKGESENSSGGKAGFYVPTTRGVLFVNGHTNVSSHVHILCGEVVGWGDSTVNIKECLGSKFSYEELMRG